MDTLELAQYKLVNWTHGNKIIEVKNGHRLPFYKRSFSEVRVLTSVREHRVSISNLIELSDDHET